MPNRLAQETSPYLLQHKDNPVDWYPWGEDALSEARRRDVPVLLSVGYAACHWCHVMEHESFEDDATAAVMNERFVCIKVDREERPDIDSVYMDAVQAMTGQGGWPMTVFLTPAGTPFYGGTYFPDEDRHGMPAFRRVLTAISEAWEQRRDDLEQQGSRLVEHLGSMARLRGSDELITEDLLHTAHGGLRSSYDPVHGGFGGAPKFPQPMNLDFLLRLAARGYEDAEEMAVHSLLQMSSGGMFDQLGGGFARYSVDAAWVVPHFEKMLYDNALLLRTFTRAWLVSGAVRLREVARATASWMLTEMRDPTGGMWSSLDADSEGVEGKFYVWGLDEILDVTGPDGDAAIEHWGITETGNFEGLNIPTYAREPTEVDALIRARAALLDRRGQRVRPPTDSKVLTSWNCLAAAALAEAGAALGHMEWVEAAREVMDFVFSTLRVDGRLMRSFRSVDDRAAVKHLGCCEDYAFALETCLSLYEATFEMRWIDEARWCADEAIRLFLDADAGGFFTTAADGERLVVRPKDLYDNAIPSANSVLALELQRLALLTGESSYEEPALGAMRLLGEVAARSPLGFGHLLGAMDFYLSEPLEIVITGADRADLMGVVRTEFLPNKVLISSSAPDEDAKVIPLLQGRASPNGATAYVCRRGTCKLPVTTPEALLEQLKS